MTKEPLQQRRVRHWTIHGVIGAIPVAIFIILGLVIHGAKLAERQIDVVATQIEHSLNHQENVLELPFLLEAVQVLIYRLYLQHDEGADAAVIAQTESDIDARLQDVMAAMDQLDQRTQFEKLDLAVRALTDRIDTARINSNQAQSMHMRNVQGYQGLFQEAEQIAKNIADETTALVLGDLAGLRQDMVNLTWFLFAGLAVFAATLLCGGLIAARGVSRPILALADTVEAMDNGDLHTEVAGINRTDEIGQVARAIARFKASLKENEALQCERDDLNLDLERKLATQHDRLTEAQKKAEHDRQDMTAQLRAEFGKVINAASAGDFAQRVVTSYADENLQSLAEDINRFVERVDDSVTAVSRTMHDMVQGELNPADDHTFTGAFADIMTQIHDTAKQISEQSIQLTHIALHDPLTDLPNRRFLEDRLTAYTKLLAFTELPLAVLHVDLDLFKEINDTLGHAAGDMVLKCAADILSALAENDDFVARVGGDEFMMLCPLVEDTAAERERIELLGNNIVQKMSEPVDFEGQEAQFGASVGIAFSTSETKDLSSLVIDADIALYQSKEAGRNQVQVFSASIASALTQKRSQRDDLLAALERDEFVPFFQPKYDAATRQLTGVEALARWQHPTKGLIPPDQFLAAANEMNIVQQIDHQILLKSANVLNDLWVNHGVEIPELSVNVSQQRLSDHTLLDSLDCLSGPFKASFELLESIFFDEQGDQFHWMLDALRERDIGIQIDDFGSGRASISALINIRPDRLKIDRHLVKPIVERQGNCQLIKGIVDIATSMNIGVTAEGVETMEHAELLHQLGCDMLQGYAFSKPLSAAQLKEFGLRKTG